VDRYGGRALLLTSYAVSAICYFTTAAATNMTMLYISR
jgi:nitrate/nitrite transporter NarK